MDENARLKRLFTDAMLNPAALEDLLGKCADRLVRAMVRDIVNEDSVAQLFPASSEWAAIAARP